jgi:hypothetical protein
VSDSGLDDRGSIPDMGSASRPALGSTQPPIQWVPAVLSPGVKRVTLTTYPHLVPRLSMSRIYTSSTPHVPPWHVAGELLIWEYDEIGLLWITYFKLLSEQSPGQKQTIRDISHNRK